MLTLRSRLRSHARGRTSALRPGVVGDASPLPTRARERVSNSHRSTALCVIVVALVGGCAGDSDKTLTTTADASVSQVAMLLATSDTHTCAQRNAGLYCWGENFAGQLGNVRTQDSPTPVLAHFAGHDIVQLALASGRTCMLRGTGTVECWGDNKSGQLGDGTRADSYTPVAAVGVHDATAIAVDESSTCALRAGGVVSCWGNSPIETPTQGSLVPVTVATLTNAVELRGASLGTFCAREADGAVKCFRFEAGGWSAPTEIADLAGARAITVTYSQAVCALDATSQVKCHSFESGRTEPLVNSMGSVAIADTGGLAVCASDAAHAWRCWPILPGTEIAALQVRSDVTIAHVVMMGVRICALREENSVACRGNDELEREPITEFLDLVPVSLPQ